MLTSNDGGATWGNANYVASTRRDASVAAGGDGYGYVAFLDDTDSTYYRVGRFTNNLVTPQWSFVTLDANADHRYHEVSVAADRTTPGASQTAITFVTHEYVPNGNIGPRYAYTQDGGVNYSASFWPPTNNSRTTWDARHPVIRRSDGSPLFRTAVTMHEPSTTWDTLVYAFSRGTSPSTWEDRNSPNDHRITGEYAAAIGYSSPAGGGYIAYREFAEKDVWLDCFANTGIAGGAEPVRSRLTTPMFGGAVRLALSHRAQVQASLFDRDGRLAAELIDGTLETGEHRVTAPNGLARGIYFLRVAVDGRTETAKLVRIQ